MMTNLEMKFHVETRAFQLFETNDPAFGFTLPKWSHSHDQVPTCMCPSVTKTINEMGKEEVYDCAGNDKDTKRSNTK